MSWQPFTAPMSPDIDLGEPPGQSGPRLSVAIVAAWVTLALGLATVAASMAGAFPSGSWSGILLPYGLLAAGSIGAILTRYARTTPGIRNDGVVFSGTTARGLVGWALGFAITAFYVVLYWFPTLLEAGIRALDPLAVLLSGKPADQWFLYGFFYTLAVSIMGLRMLMRYRHNRYQLVRTGSVIFFQLGFAFLLPQVLKAINQPEYYFTYFWPLKPDYLYPPSQTGWLWKHPVGIYFLGVGALSTFVVTPLLTYFVGKRWYCSWVCGCGGLAETLGDPFRHLSSKTVRSWRIERWSIHSVLVAIVGVTALLWINEVSAGSVLGNVSQTAKSWYGFAIGAAFSGVIGVGFYPLLGSRVWCRFGCPMAAILGLIQRFFSRFRITTNGSQCMACGNCSKYCEMGIDVRSYAHRGANIVRASCVGCGVCAAVCPRGVLRLENGETHADRFDGADKPLREVARSLGLSSRG